MSKKKIAAVAEEEGRRWEILWGITRDPALSGWISEANVIPKTRSRKERECTNVRKTVAKRNPS